MVTKRAKQAVKAAAEAKASQPVAAKKAGRSGVVKKVSYKTGALVKKVKGRMSGLKLKSKDEPWKKVLAVTETFCEKVSEKTADVYGKVTEIVKKSTADMTESFKAGMTSVKETSEHVPAARKARGVKAKTGRKKKSRVEKFMKDEAAPVPAPDRPAVEVPAPAAQEQAPAVEAIEAANQPAEHIEAVAPLNAELEQEIAQITDEIKET